MQINDRDLWNQLYEDAIIAKGTISFPFLTFKCGISVLDIGCGPGYDLEYLVKRFGIEGYGVDHVMNKQLKSKKSKKINFVLADASHLPFKENTFEIAVIVSR